MKKINFFQAVGIFTVVLLSASVANAASFQDVPTSHVNSDAIEYVKTNGIVAGYPDGSFKPDNTINRAEFTKIIVGAQFDQATIDNCLTENTQPSWTYVFFPDVPKDAWFAKYICVAKMNNIVMGYPDGSFKPDNNINFAEASKIIANAFGYTVATDPIWYKPFVGKLGEKKAIPATITNFSDNITRGEMAEMVYRLKANVVDKISQTYDDIAAPSNAPESIVSIDGTWNKYTNNNFGFSIMVPKETMDGATQVFSDKEAVYIANEYSMQNRQYLKTTLASAQKDSTWKIIVREVHNETELNQFIKEVYPPECKMDHLSPLTSQEDVFAVNLNPPKDAGEGCFVNWVSNILYSPSRNKVAKWDIGQDPRFIPKQGGEYDREMSNSFRFIDKSAEGNPSKLTEANECVKEGESFLDAPPGSPYSAGADKVTTCCKGLEKRDTYISYNFPQCVINKGPRVVCVKCGNGICGPGENACNCPEDCK